MPIRRTPYVAVIGGGVLGVSIAGHLARAGASVVLVTESQLASNASGRSLSWLNSAGVRSAAYHRLRMVGIDRYRTLASAHPDTDWLRFDGGLRWTAAGDDAALRRDHEHEVGLGYDSRLLTPDEVARRVPGVDSAAVPVGGAILNPGEGWVDLPSLIDHLVRDLLDHGGEVLTGTGPARVQLEGDRVREVRTARGDRIEVDAAVLATGPGVPRAAAELGITIPDATPLALLVRTAPLETAPPRGAQHPAGGPAAGSGTHAGRRRRLDPDQHRDHR